jgi:hypothetical protein
MIMKHILLIGSVIAIISGLWVFSSLLTSPDVHAHDEPIGSYPGCSGSSPFEWSGSNATYWRDSSWDSSYKNAISNAIGNFNPSDFTWSFQSDEDLADVIWADLGDLDFAIAGLAEMYVFCSTNIFNGVSSISIFLILTTLAIPKTRSNAQASMKWGMVWASPTTL